MEVVILLDKPYQVLIIDDAPDIVELIRLILEDQGITCITAANGDIGLNIAREGRIDLIILDILMPDPDGFSVCKSLKDDKSTAQIPIIFITAKGDDDSIAKGFELGAVDYISKPFNRYEMLRRVETHLRIVGQSREMHNIICVKNRVMSIISHEIRNQFSSLMSVYEIFADQLKDNGTPSIQRHLIKLSSGLVETHDLFDNLITWSKNQRGKLKVHNRKVHIYSVIQEIETALEGLLSHKELILENHINPGLFVESDEMLVTLIIRNFITNAIKFSYRGNKIRVLSMKREGQTGIAVRDFGTGVDPRIRDRLFHIEENPTTIGTEREKGTGIGLIICKDFAESIEAELDIDSEYGKGSDFILFFPNAVVLE